MAIFFKVAGSSDVGVKSYQVLVTEMPPPSLFAEQFRSGTWCCQACSRYTEIQRRGTVGNVHVLFIYKLAVPYHVKLTPLMDSCLSCLKDRLSPSRATHWLPGSVAVCLLWAASYMESTCQSLPRTQPVSKGLSH